MNQEYYSGIDGLRTVATIGIIMMHIRVNSKYSIPGYIFDYSYSGISRFCFVCDIYTTPIQNRRQSNYKAQKGIN